MKTSFAFSVASLLVFTACASSGANGGTLTEEERSKRFTELFEKEVQNRAFALRAAERSLAAVSSEGDKLFLGTWLEWEQYLKRAYTPYAKKYGLSQEPRTGAEMRATLGGIAAGISPDSVYELMLDQTISYIENLRELERVSPEEDRAFFIFVVKQEEKQIEALRFRVKNEYKKASDVLRKFMAASPAI